MAFTAPESDLEEKPAGFTAPETDLDAPDSGGFSAPEADVAGHVDSLAGDWSNYDPYNDDTQDYDTRVAVIQKRHTMKRPVADTVAKTAQAVGGAVKGVADFVRAPFQALSGAGHSVMGAMSSDPEKIREAGRLSTEAMSAAQSGVMSGVDTAKKVLQLGGTAIRGVRGAVDTLSTGKPLENATEHRLGGWMTPDVSYTPEEIKARLIEMDAARKERDAVSKGDFAETALNRPAYTPEQLESAGKPVRPERVESMSMAFDPTNLIPGLALPGASAIGGKALQVAGKAAQIPAKFAGAVAERIPGVRLVSRFIPKQQIAETATAGTAGAGRFLEQAGKELSGTALAPADRGIFASGAARLVKGAAEGGASMLPFAVSQDTPEGMAGTLATGAGIGAGFGMAKNPLTSRFANADRVRSGPSILKDAAFDYNSTPDLDALHNEAVSRLSPEQRTEINQIRHLTQGNLEYYVLPEAAFNAKAQEHGADTAQGFYETTVDGKKTVFVKEGVQDPIQTGWHEVGHNVIADLDPATRQRAIAALVRGNDIDGFTARYLQGLGQKPVKFSELPPDQQQAIGEELLSEQTSLLMRGQNIDTLAQGKPVLKRQLQQLLGRIAESFGYRMNAAEAKSILQVNPSFTAAAIIEGALQKMAAGAGEAPAYGGELSVENRIAQLEPIAAQPITGATTMPQRKAIQDAQAELQQLRADIAPKTPQEAPQPVPAPNPPTAPENAPQAVSGAPAPLSAQEQAGRLAAAAELAKAAQSSPAVPIAQINVPESRKNAPTQESAAEPATSNRATETAVAEAEPKVAAPPEKAPSVERIDRSFFQQFNKGTGINMAEAADVIAEKVSTALKEGAEVIFYVDGGKRAVKVTAINRGMMQDASGQRWGIFVLAAPAGSERIEITKGGSIPQRAPAAQPAQLRARTTEEITARVQQAEAEARAAKTGQKGKASDSRVQAAKVKAVLDLIGNPKDGTLQRQVDDFGTETIAGRFDPQNELHRALADLGGGISEKAVEALQATQEAEGKARYIRYRSAKSNTADAKEGEADFGMRTREREYGADPAAGRKEGTVQHKVIVPVGTEFTKDGRPIARFYTLDNLLHNADSAFAFAKAKGIETGYPEGPGREDQLFQDAQDYAENHANGYRGDGQPIQQFPDTGLPRPNPDYAPKTIPENRLGFLNMLFADEASTASARHAEKARQYAEKTAAGEKPRKPAEPSPRARASELEAVTLAQKNSRWVDPDTGETNRLRKEFRDAGFDFGNEFKTPLETLSPEHILEISEAPLKQQQGDVPSVRPTGFTGDPAKLAGKGLPKAKAVRAAFQPEDTGKPGESGIPAENLAREAEAAGIHLSKETLFGLMRQDAKTMEAIRKRIETITGRKARFMPGTPRFNAWFGGSKVKDDSGNPLRVFHGTNDIFTTFSHDHPNKKDTGWLGSGFYFFNDPKLAGEYTLLKAGRSPNVIPAYLKLENPYMAAPNEKERIMLAERRGDTDAALRRTRELISQGYDGVILDYGDWRKGVVEYVVFNPEQIKSATGNSGEYDPNNPDIRMQPSGSSKVKEAARQRLKATGAGAAAATGRREKELTGR